MPFSLSAIHAKALAEGSTQPLAEYCERLRVPFYEAEVTFDPAKTPASVCSVCARCKRGAMRTVCLEKGIDRLAFGHHADDAAETFFMNLVQHGRLGSFCPRVTLPGSAVDLIRPLIYLDQRTILAIHRRFRLPEFSFICRFEQKNLRERFRSLLITAAEHLGRPNLSLRIVRALEHLDERNLWSACRAENIEPEPVPPLADTPRNGPSGGPERTPGK